MIRIIAGALRGRKLSVPSAKLTRPTTDRVRESIFNLLENALAKRNLSFSHMTILDAYAGTGALGFEALSRGAHHVTFFEKNNQVLQILKTNGRALGLNSNHITITYADTLRPPASRSPVDLIFLDPPYFKGVMDKSLDTLYRTGWLGDKTILVLEQHISNPIPQKKSLLLDKPHCASVWAIDRIYGQSRVLIDTLFDSP